MEELSQILKSSLCKYVIIIDDTRNFGFSHDCPDLTSILNLINSADNKYSIYSERDMFSVISL